MKDKVATSDQVVAGISHEVVTPDYGCPKCAQAMKDANTRASRKAGLDLRICSSRACRYQANWASGKPVEHKEPAEPDSEPVLAVASPPPAPDQFACPNCGKATKDANTVETKAAGLDVRICSSRPCRVKTEWSTGMAKLYTDPA